MSTVRRTSAIYNAHFATVAALQPKHANQFKALTEGLTSSALAEYRTMFDEDYSVNTISDAQELWSTVENSIPFERVFSDATFSEFSHIESLIEALDQFGQDDIDGELNAFHSDLLAAIETAQFEMAAVEQRGTAHAIELALHDLGYHVESASLDGVVTGIEASRANSKLVVEVTAGGEVTTDFVGLSDTETCGSAQNALVERAATYGVDLAEHDRHDHRDTRGGGLVQRVARASGRTLAERIVSAHKAATATNNLNKQARAIRTTKKASA